MNFNMVVGKYFFGNSIFLSLLVLISISFGLIGGCGGSSGNSSDGQGSSFNLKFKDVTLASGFNYSHGFPVEDTNPKGLPQSESQLISGGVASGDYNNDGWVDLYVVHGPVGPDLLFKNLGNGTFEEVSETAGIDLSGRLGSGPIFADIDGDGNLDLLVGGVELTDIVLFHNNGDGTFEDISEVSGIDVQNNFSAAFGDYDLDGDIDLFLTHWGTRVRGGMTSNHLWRNNGDSTFTDASLAS